MNDSDTSTVTGFSQGERLLAVDSVLGPGALLMTRLDGEDAISRCFLYRVEVVATVPDASVEALIGEPVTLWLLGDDQDTKRPIHGHVRSVAGLGRDGHGNRRFALEVVPRLWFLSCTCDCRIFQHQSVPEILRTVFMDQGLIDVTFRILQDDYPKLEYCVQYEESALDFVSRLMEHLGLFYWHEHSADRHLLVIADRNDATEMCDPAVVCVSPNPQSGEIQTLDFRSVFRPGKWTLNDYDFQSPTKRLLVDTPTTLDVPLMHNHEIYRWAGEFTQHDNGRRLSRLRMEMEEARQRVVSGTGHCATFDPGRRVGISEARNDTGKVYLLTEVRHHLTAPGLETQSDTGYTYTNEFVAILATTPYRPSLVTPKPVMRGAQAATVVGPAGETIFCDPYGRIRVQFHWDRRGHRDEHSSCWMRVSQTRAGSYYGSMVIPHVGHEVLIGFLEGDPDRPLITGSVPNALTMPPMELPFDKHKTIQRDHGDNRMIMQGKPGQEHLSLVSPRRLNSFAVKPGARPLSAGVQTLIGDQTPYSFLNDAIDPFKDAVGLYEVWESWYLLNNPTDTQVPPPPTTLIGPDGQPLTGSVSSDMTNEQGQILKITSPTPASTTTTTTTTTTTSTPATSSTPSTTTSTTSTSAVTDTPATSTTPESSSTTTTTGTSSSTVTPVSSSSSGSSSSSSSKSSSSSSSKSSTGSSSSSSSGPKTTITSTTAVTSTPAKSSYKASDAGPGVDFKAEECDINSFTTGRNNAVSLNNKNTWVWADNNTWVHQDSNSRILGNSNGYIGGDSTSDVEGHSTSTIRKGSVSTVYRSAMSMVYGSRTNITFGANESFILGDHLSVTVGAIEKLELAEVFNLSLTDVHEFAPFKTDTNAVKIKEIETELKSVETTVSMLVDNIMEVNLLLHI